VHSATTRSACCKNNHDESALGTKSRKWGRPKWKKKKGPNLKYERLLQ